jgi:16S rRNA (guanine527-N7)-methyltransferase
MALASRRVLAEVIGQARTLGFFGPGAIDVQLRHAEGFVSIARSNVGTREARLLDLGSGGGLPGLVVASDWPEAHLTLLDANGRRAAFLRQALTRLGFSDRVSVVQARAETAGRAPDLRAHFDAVLARSFGRPAVTAECAAPFLLPGGWLVVSEPPEQAGESPDDPEEPPGPSTRWPAEPLAKLGLEPTETVHAEFAYQVLGQKLPCPDRYPRRDGVPARKPLF